MCGYSLSRLFSLFLLAGAVPVGAQTFDQLAPQVPPAAPAPALPEAPVPAPAAPGDDRVLVPVLRGLVFLSSAGAVQAQGVAGEGLQVSAVPLLGAADFRALATGYLGRPLSLRALNLLTRDVVLYFRQHGRPVVDVLVPAQNISTGTVQILVVEGRLGTVRSEGNAWFSDAQLTGSVRARPGGIIEGAPLLEDLAWINRNPFRQVDLVFSRGTAAGETDVILRTRDRYPLRAYAGYEDSGNALTGFDRLIAGFNWGNALGRDHQLNYQLSASPDFRKMVAHSGSYLLPIPAWRHTLTAFGSYAESRPVLAGGMFDLKGRTWQASVRYRLPMPSVGTWTRHVSAGLDFKRSNNNLSFGGTQVFAQETDIAQAIAALGASHTDRRGVTSGELTLVFSPGGLTSGNRAGAFRVARTGAEPGYAYARLEVERVAKFRDGFTWLASGTLQLASTSLLGSEQLGLGGAGNLRGYEEREANGDSGLFLINELQGPALQLAGRLGRPRAVEKLVPLLFLDAGVVSNHDLLPGEAKRHELASAGVGVRYSLGGRFTLRADYGWQLRDSGVSDHRRGQRGHISAVLAY